MAKKEKAEPVAEYRHHTSIGEDGQILYDAPVRIQSEADLDNFRIKRSDCRTLTLGGERILVYFVQVKDRTVADYMWASLDTEHSRGYASNRCMIRGKRKAWIRCPDTVSCATCPNRDSKRSPVISLNGLVEVGYEPEFAEPAEDAAIAKKEYSELCAIMNAEDPRLAIVLELKVLHGESVAVIASRFGIGVSRIYQMLNRIKEIGQAYKEKNR